MLDLKCLLIILEWFCKEDSIRRSNRSNKLNILGVLTLVYFSQRNIFTAQDGVDMSIVEKEYSETRIIIDSSYLHIFQDDSPRVHKLTRQHDPLKMHAE